MNEISPKDQILILRCRLIADFNICVALSTVFALSLIGLAITQSLKPPEIEASAFALSLTLSAPFYWLIARIRGAIITDENGVCWRTALGKWKSARWDEIESCDLRLTSTTTQWKFVISTRNGAFSYTRRFQNSAQFAPFAALFCPLIPPETENWPRFFGADTFENRVMPWLAFPVLGAYLFGVLWKVFSSPPSYWATQISFVREICGWPLAIFAVVAAITLMVILPALLLLVFWDGWKRNFLRRREFFIANRDGVTYQSAQNPPLFVAWAELGHLHTESRYGAPGLAQHRLETARGELHWNSALHGWEEFDRMLYQRAPELPRSVARGLRTSFSDAPDPQSEAQIFDFKTRELRAVLFFLGFVCLICLGFAVFGPPPNQNEPAPQWSFVVGFVSLSAMEIYGVMLYRGGQITLDSRGMTRKFPFKTHFAAWQDVRELGKEKSTFLRVGETKWSLAAPFPPAHFAFLLREIERRIANAKITLPSDDTGSDHPYFPAK